MRYGVQGPTVITVAREVHSVTVDPPPGDTTARPGLIACSG